MTGPAPDLRQIEHLRIRNYRALKDLTLGGLTPVTALLGPNGSGKSTVFDALAFLQEAFTKGLAEALGRRGGIAELRTRGAEEPISIELGYRDSGREEFFVYRIDVDEEEGSPVVVRETLVSAEGTVWLDFTRGDGHVLAEAADTEEPAEDIEHMVLGGPAVLAAAALGQLARYRSAVGLSHRVARLQVSSPDVERIRVSTPSRTPEVLSSSGDNLASVVQRLQTRRPEVWESILRSLRRYVPTLRDVIPERLGDGRWIVLVSEYGVDQPILPEHVSDGTLKLLGYLVAVHSEAWVLLLEEPENHVHPQVHYRLAEDLRLSDQPGQVLVATHSSYFVDALRPEEVWVFYRDEQGYTQARRAADLPELMAMVEAGGLLGSLWTEGFFGLGDPLTRSGRPR
ncbi:AAA family ATPase [Kutzneria viridogrisea]|uniref:ATPase n=1 Tax=Kutzneria viridogrisea TaxID=47990 RepID=A0ABR6BPW4_9PSEU|nr:putative ATPase [Kutzneria viridogrisea]